MGRRLGLFGGTFDPIHNGHLLIAEVARETAGLDEIIFVPSHKPPHKTDQVVASFEDRLAMTSLAVAGTTGFSVSDIEQSFSDLSYTVQTVRWFKHNRPEDETMLIIGSDSLLALPTWREPDALVSEVPLVVYRRLESDPTHAEQRFLRRATIIDHPIVDVSSSWIRQRILENRPIRFLVPQEVEQYILNHQLYRFS